MTQGMDKDEKPSALLLGMVFTNDEGLRFGHQLERDGLRCRALEDYGAEVYTIDTMHAPSLAVHGKHIQHDFCHVGVLGEMDKTWRGKTFTFIIMDYNRTPTSWYSERWNHKMYTMILPTLACKGALKVDGEIWLPNIPNIKEDLEKIWYSHLKHWYSRPVQVNDPSFNPLYTASQNVEDKLRCTVKSSFCNASALKELNKKSPFIMLKCVKSGNGLQPNEAAGCGSLITVNDEWNSRKKSLRLHMTSVPVKIQSKTGRHARETGKYYFY
jgi:hypothetical protein